MSPLLTINQVASRLAVSPKTVRRWIKNNKIVFITLPGGLKRIKEENLERWVENKSSVLKKIA